MKLTTICKAIAITGALSAVAHAQIARPTVTFAASDATPESRFGWAVDLDGDRALVGAPRDATTAPLGGAAYVFERQAGGQWLEVAKLVPSQVVTLSQVGHAVALDGDRAVVTSREYHFATIFERQSNGTWLETATVTPPFWAVSFFGNSVALEGDRLVVGDAQGTFFHPSQGRLCVFERDANGAWPHVATATVSAPTQVFLASTLALDGDRMAIGSSIHDHLNFDTGAVFAFERQPNGTWPQTDFVLPTISSAMERFGEGVALQGDTLVVGASGSGSLVIGSGKGAAYVFERQSDATWLEVQRIAPSNLSANDVYGSCVALDGEHLLVAAPGSDVQSSDGGALHVLRREANGQFVEQVVLTSAETTAGDFSGVFAGRCLAIDGGRALHGAPGTNTAEGVVHEFAVGTLYHGRRDLSLLAAQSQDLFVRAGSTAAGALFLVLGSATGDAPGVPLAPGVTLPLVVDAYTNLGLVFATPVQPSFGVLDGQGAANTMFKVPAGASASFAGLTLHHACLTIDLTTFVVGATNAVQLTLVP